MHCYPGQLLLSSGSFAGHLCFQSCQNKLRLRAVTILCSSGRADLHTPECHWWAEMWQDHRMVEKVTLKLLLFQPPLPWAETASTGPGCPKPHSTWPLNNSRDLRATTFLGRLCQWTVLQAAARKPTAKNFLKWDQKNRSGCLRPYLSDSPTHFAALLALVPSPGRWPNTALPAELSFLGPPTHSTRTNALAHQVSRSWKNWPDIMLALLTGVLPPGMLDEPIRAWSFTMGSRKSTLPVSAVLPESCWGTQTVCGLCAQPVLALCLCKITSTIIYQNTDISTSSSGNHSRQ